MIRRALLAVALLAGSANVASAELVFVGTIKFTAQTAACQRNRVNEFANSVFHPAGTLGNDNFAGLSWVWSHYSLGHEKSPGNFAFGGGLTPYSIVKTGGTGWGDPYTVPDAERSQIRILSYVPALAAITPNTQNLTITGQIKRFDRESLNCVLNFVGTYVRDSRQNAAIGAP